MKKYIVIKDFSILKETPNGSPNELFLKKGDIVFITKREAGGDIGPIKYTEYYTIQKADSEEFLISEDQIKNNLEKETALNENTRNILKVILVIVIILVILKLTKII